MASRIIPFRRNPFPAGSLASPAIGAVTCLSPRQLGTARSYLTNSLFWALIALLVGTLFGLLETPREWGILYTISVALSWPSGHAFPTASTVTVPHDCPAPHLACESADLMQLKL